MKKRAGYEWMAGVGAAALVSVMTAGTAFAGTWQSEGDHWKYQQDDGQMAVQGWVQDGEGSYAFDENGYMRIGWYQEPSDGRWYFLDTRIGGPQGKALTGWQWIDGSCYYLDPQQGGAMAAACTTPDGYPVGADGAWTDDSGQPRFEEGRGISSREVIDITAQASDDGTGLGGLSVSGASGSSLTWSTSNGAWKTDTIWSDYSDDSVSHSANNFTTGNYEKMSSSQIREMERAISDFQSEYITSDMSDFEIELQIIQWLVENCSYEKGENWENATAYSCIVNGEAQCSGYADAFLQTAKACGLEARYVHNSSHAWNLVRLDGDWYHVDVTWEDPVGSMNDYGFGNLRNKYINLEDSEISGYACHHTWSPDSTKAKGIKYGSSTVAEYMESGVVDTSKAKSYEERMDELFDSLENADGSNVIYFTDADSTADAICSYYDAQIEARESEGTVVVHYPGTYSSARTGDYSKLVNYNIQITDKVKAHVDTKYEDVLGNKMAFFLFLQQDADGRYYSYDTVRFYYKPAEVSYAIRYLDANGRELGTQSGVTNEKTSVRFEFPDGYTCAGTDGITVRSGNVTYTAKTVYMKDASAVNLDVTVQLTKQAEKRAAQTETAQEEETAETTVPVEEKETVTEISTETDKKEAATEISTEAEEKETASEAPQKEETTETQTDTKDEEKTVEESTDTKAEEKTVETLADTDTKEEEKTTEASTAEKKTETQEKSETKQDKEESEEKTEQTRDKSEETH